MARFALSRDIRFFEGISRELVDAVVTTAVVLYKLVIEDSKTNLTKLDSNKKCYKKCLWQFISDNYGKICIR